MRLLRLSVIRSVNKRGKRIWYDRMARMAAGYLGAKKEKERTKGTKETRLIALFGGGGPKEIKIIKSSKNSPVPKKPIQIHYQRK